MHFAQIDMLIWVWVVIGLVFFLIWAHKHRTKILQSFTQEHLLKDIMFHFNPKKAQYKSILIVAVALFSVLALLRPQWGFRWQEVKRQGIDILVIIDTSKSMLTQDVKPNRLERTKFAVLDLLKKLRGDRIGLIAFSGEPFLICPLTVDYGGFQISLNDLSIETIPRGGTNIAKAIRESIKDYGKISSKHKAIIIVTDGDDLEGDPIAAAREAYEKGIKIFTVGIGSAEGELIQMRNQQGEFVFLKDNKGNIVKSRLNERLLKEIALITGGVYIKASGSQFGLDLIYDQEISRFEKREIEAKMKKKYHERFQFPLGFAALLLVIETCITTRRKQPAVKSSS